MQFKLQYVQPMGPGQHIASGRMICSKTERSRLIANHLGFRISLRSSSIHVPNNPSLVGVIYIGLDFAYLGLKTPSGPAEGEGSIDFLDRAPILYRPTLCPPSGKRERGEKRYREP